MTTQAKDDDWPVGAGATAPGTNRGHVRDLAEIFVTYGLILLVIWTPRPMQRWFYIAALAWVVVSFSFSYAGWKELGFRAAGFRRSLWVVGVAVMVAAVAVALAARLHTLHEPHGPAGWVRSFAGYAVWSLVQQLLLQGYFLLRLQRLLPGRVAPVIAAAGLFATAHLPNPILTPATLVWGLVACMVFVRFRNIYPLAMAHAIFGICIAITVPAPVVRNMRVGLGYVRYHAPQPLHLSKSDQNVSTVAWVMAEAPTRRWARQARP